MKKDEYIGRYGKAACEKWQQQSREWGKNHPEVRRRRVRLWRKNNPEKVKISAQVTHREVSRKGGKYYKQHRRYQMNGIPHEKELIRKKHEYHYLPFKQIIAPESQIHHEWLSGTADYRGVALVEADQHQYGFIDVIRILEGEITLLTEEEIMGGGQI